MERVFVEDDGTARRTFDVDGFFPNDLESLSLGIAL